MELTAKLLIAGAIMGLLDYIWLGYLAKRLYHSEMSSILRKKPNMTAALLFYCIYVVGVIIFVIDPALANESFMHAVWYGAAFGLVAYATYDLTNLAVIKGFTIKVVIVDLIWGMFITAMVAATTFLAMQSWF